MRNKGKLFALSILVAGAAVATASATAAWFQTSVLVEPDSSLIGRSKGAYFGGGDGSSDHPYIIMNKNHVYNLAWLYYLGYFDGQTPYFRVDADVAMEGLVLPPIGTDDHPFLGHFNGNSHSISGFRVSNQIGAGQIELKPTSVTAQNFDRPEIVGFFGVVGPLSGDYSPSVANVYDVHINNFTAESTTSSVLIGLAAGYVNGAISGITVGGTSSIKVGGSTPLDSANLTDNISDYGLVGYIEKTATASEFTKEISNLVHKTSSGGTSGGFGASVRFADYVDWFYDLHETSQYDTYGRMRGAADTDQIKTGANSNYKLVYRVANDSQVTDPHYEFGFGYKNARTTNDKATSYAFSFNATATGYEGKYAEYEKDFASGPSAGPYLFTATKTTRGGKNAYVLTFSTTVPRFGQSKFDLLQMSATSASYYVVKTGSTSYSSNKLFNSAFMFADNRVYHLRDNCYIPLKFTDDTNTSVSTENTGYIIGTNYNNNTNNHAGSPRIAAYSTNYVGNSLTDGLISSVNTYHNGAWTTITDTKGLDDEGNSVVVESSIAYERYIKSRNAVGSAIEGKVVISGIHFEANPSLNYPTGGPRGSIQQDAYTEQTALFKSYNGTAKETRMPLGSIDFELEKSGVINFFAGTYNATSGVKNNFFSLYHVDRTGPKAYTLHEIKKIYQATDHTDAHKHYIYEYADSTYSESSSLISGSAIFDLSVTLWPARPTANENKLYYFEIPVNAGEFAMGAVDSSHITESGSVSGAYLIYLDLGSNGQSNGDNEMDIYSVKTTSSSDVYPGGVDFGITGLTSAGGNTICLAITYDSAAVNGEVTFVVGSQVEIDAEMATEYAYIRSNAVYDDSGSTVEPGSLSGSPGFGERIIRANIVDYEGTQWEIVLEQQLDNNGAVTSSAYTTITADGVDMTVADLPEIFTAAIDSDGSITNSETAVTLSYIGTNFSTTVAYTGADHKKVEITIPAGELGSTVLDVDITASYSASINGTDVSDGGTYPAS